MPRMALSTEEFERARDSLCDAALLLYKQEGYDALSFRKLATVTGSSHTQPYRYFENKEQLFAAVRLACFKRFAALIRSSDLPAAGPATRLQAIHAAIMQYVQDEPAEYQLMFSMEQPSLESYPQLLSVRRQAFDYLVDIIQQAVDQGLLSGDARSLMHVAWGAVHGLLSLHAAGQLVHGRNLQELAQPLLQQVLAPLFPEPETPAAGDKTMISQDRRLA